MVLSWYTAASVRSLVDGANTVKWDGYLVINTQTFSLEICQSMNFGNCQLLKLWQKVKMLWLDCFSLHMVFSQTWLTSSSLSIFASRSTAIYSVAKKGLFWELITFHLCQIQHNLTCSEDLCKLGKEYLNALTCNYYSFSRKFWNFWHITPFSH